MTAREGPCTADFTVTPRLSSGRVVDFDVTRFVCRGCGEAHCHCPEPIQTGICPPMDGRRRDDAPTSGRGPFHSVGNSRG
jgi:hypothetical protein